MYASVKVLKTEPNIETLLNSLFPTGIKRNTKKGSKCLNSKFSNVDVSLSLGT